MHAHRQNLLAQIIIPNPQHTHHRRGRTSKLPIQLPLNMFRVPPIRQPDSPQGNSERIGNHDGIIPVIVDLIVLPLHALFRGFSAIFSPFLGLAEFILGVGGELRGFALGLFGLLGGLGFGLGGLGFGGVGGLGGEVLGGLGGRVGGFGGLLGVDVNEASRGAFDLGGLGGTSGGRVSFGGV